MKPISTDHYKAMVCFVWLCGSLLCINELGTFLDDASALDDVRASFSVFGLRNARMRKWISVAQGITVDKYISHCT